MSGSSRPSILVLVEEAAAALPALQSDGDGCGRSRGNAHRGRFSRPHGEHPRIAHLTPFAALRPDALWQGPAATLAELARTLVGQPVWRLWFD